MNGKFLGLLVSVFLLSCRGSEGDSLDLSHASLLISPSIEEAFQKTAETVLSEEIGKRTGLRLDSSPILGYGYRYRCGPQW